jgi:hypothetical protein
MKTYWADVAFIVEPRRERASFIHFTAKNHKAAVESAIRFAKDREKVFKDWTFCCLKVGLFVPGPIDPEGRLQPAAGGGFFEWKYDWPGTIEERVEALTEKVRQ